MAVQLTLKVSDETYARMQELSRRLGVPLNEVVRLALALYVGLQVALARHERRLTLSADGAELIIVRV